MINAHYDMDSDTAVERLMQLNASKAVLYGRQTTGTVLSLKREDGAIEAYRKEYIRTENVVDAQNAYFKYLKSHPL